MEAASVVAYLVAILLMAAVAAYKKIQSCQSNLPSPGLLWFRLKKNHTTEEFRDFAVKNHAGMVHGFIETFKGRPLLRSTAIITRPELAQIVLKDEETFQKDPYSLGDVNDLMRESLLNQNLEGWRAMKEVFAPAFHYEAIVKMVNVMTGKTEVLLDIWEERGGKNLQIVPDCHHFTLDALGLAAFGIDFDSIHGGSHEYLSAYNTIIDVDPNKDRKKVEIAKKELSKLTYDIIAARNERKDGANIDEKDFLDRLLTANLSNEQVRDNIFMLFVAGHETTAHALSWALHFLAAYPDVQKRAREEVDLVLQGATPNAESVKGLTYLDMFIKEVLRYKPPIAAIVTRIATKDVQVGTYNISKGTAVGLGIFAIQHNEEFWPEPDKFDPLRFSPERSAGRHPFAYLPFSLGRRNCIGNNLSLLEQKLFLAMVLQRFTLEKSEGCTAPQYSVWRLCWAKSIKLNATRRDSFVKVAPKHINKLHNNTAS